MRGRCAAVQLTKHNPTLQRRRGLSCVMQFSFSPSLGGAHTLCLNTKLSGRWIWINAKRSPVELSEEKLRLIDAFETTLLCCLLLVLQHTRCDATIVVQQHFLTEMLTHKRAASRRMQPTNAKTRFSERTTQSGQRRRRLHTISNLTQISPIFRTPNPRRLIHLLATTARRLPPSKNNCTHPLLFRTHTHTHTRSFRGFCWLFLTIAMHLHSESEARLS